MLKIPSIKTFQKDHSVNSFEVFKYQYQYNVFIKLVTGINQRADGSELTENKTEFVTVEKTIYVMSK